MNKDPRYNLIRPLYDAGRIKYFTDIFLYIPKTRVALDMGKKVSRFSQLIKRVGDLTLSEIMLIASFCGLNESEIFRLVEAEYIRQKKKRRQ